jgi:dipeptidyl aminopeptidase/acylaminoacyl peptidase
MFRVIKLVLVLALALTPLALGTQAGAITDETVVYSKGRKVFAIESDGSLKTLLFAPNSGRTCCVDYSADGSRAAFLHFSKGGDNTGLKSAKTDGSRTSSIAPLRWDVISWAWRPDGKRIAFNVFKKDRRGVYVSRPNGKGRMKLYEGASSGDLKWSHDGMKLSFSVFKKSKSHIYYWDFNTNELYQVPGDPSLDVSGATWSPTEDSFFFYVFEETPDGLVFPLYVVNSDNTDLVRLTDEGESVGSAYWAPDGSEIVFQTCCGDESLQDEIYVIKRDGQGRHSIAEDSDEPGVQSSLFLQPFAPDGTSIAYEDYRYDSETFAPISTILYVGDLSGNFEMVYEDTELNFLGWSPDSTRALVCRFSSETADLSTEVVTLATGTMTPFLARTCDADWDRRN